MRTLIMSLLALGLSVSAWAGYDYTISSGYSDDIILENSQSLLMTGGGVFEITAKDFSVVNIQNTAPFAVGSGGIANLIAFNWSTLKFSGGQINRIDIGQNATAVLSGGQINQITSGYSYASLDHIKIICQSASYNSTTKYLTGIWKDGSDFSIKFVDRTGYSSVISNVTIIPEPASLLLIGLGGLLLRRKRS